MGSGAPGANRRDPAEEGLCRLSGAEFFSAKKFLTIAGLPPPGKQADHSRMSVTPVRYYSDQANRNLDCPPEFLNYDRFIFQILETGPEFRLIPE
jgi:hypothetical protein